MSLQLTIAYYCECNHCDAIIRKKNYFKNAKLPSRKVSKYILKVNVFKKFLITKIFFTLGWTPLHEACNHGFLDIAKFLLEAGAIVNSKGFNDDYPLHDAVMNEHVDVSA